MGSLGLKSVVQGLLSMVEESGGMILVSSFDCLEVDFMRTLKNLIFSVRSEIRLS
jgi:hypothetical protein